jgi:hypothetical protein
VEAVNVDTFMECMLSDKVLGFAEAQWAQLTPASRNGAVVQARLHADDVLGHVAAERAHLRLQSALLRSSGLLPTISVARAH